MKINLLGKLKKRLAAFGLAVAVAASAVPAVPVYADQTPVSWDIAQRAGTVSFGEAVTNTYILEVSTGTILKGGNADNILYFAVHYTTVNGKPRSVIIMPGTDGLQRGYEIAAGCANTDTRQKRVQELFGYQPFDPSARTALGSVQTDQFLFETPEAVATIDKIQIFGKATSARSDWPCQGMRVYSVEKLYGLDMYGWYSDTPYIDFDGKVIADAAMGSGGGNFIWSNSGGTFNVTRMNTTGGAAGIVLVNEAEKETFENTYHMTTSAGAEHKAQGNNRVVLRLDFADQGNAGLESMAGFYAAKNDSKISDQKLCEAAAMVIRYKDIYGCYRDISLPLVINALGSLESASGDISIAGFAQQGDSIAIPALLPDFASLETLGIIVGESEVREKTGLVRSAAAFSDERRAARAKQSETDSISYLCFAAYTDVTLTASLDGALVKYDYGDVGESNPVRYSTATAVEGLLLDSGSLKNISLQSYNKNIVLAPVDRVERYLITVSTDNVLNAGTVSDVMIRFKYTSLKGKELESPEYSIRDYVRAFYGEWTGNVADFAYSYGMSQGSTVQFMIPLQGVKEFTDVSVRLSGEDEWQVVGISAALVNAYSSRTAQWQEVASAEKLVDGSGPRFTSHLQYSRLVSAQSVCFQMGTVYPPGQVQPDPQDETSGWNPGTLIQDDGESHYFDGSGTPVGTKEDIDWNTIRHYMTYEDAQKNLGFTKERCRYDITVYVDKEKVNTEEDDCGSKNLFYFQLIFENGKSGCTLANQQLPGDAFRTGTAATFEILTSQDYGDLVAIQIIPDNQDGNGDIYDKLKLEKIEVTKDTDSYVNPTWTATGSAEDGKLGWIGIDYQDPGEVGTYKGAAGHTVAELATTFLITESSYTAKFLVGITTAPYGKSDNIGADGTHYQLPDPTLAGGMIMDYQYYNSDGGVETVSGVDVIKLMDEYSGRTGTHTRTVSLTGEDGEVEYYVSNPGYQFRAGTTDYFFVSVKDLWEFIDMHLFVRSDVETNWNISNVSIYVVKSSGVRYINANGEYAYRFTGEGPKLLTEWSREENLSQHMDIYRDPQKTPISDVHISFELQPLEMSDMADAWTSQIAREPKSSNDTFNLFLYPAAGDAIVNPTDYDMTAAVRYTDATTLAPMQVSTGAMHRGVDLNGNTVFYALGLNAKNMKDLSGVDVKSLSNRVMQTPLRYGLLQRVRGGVLLETYYLGSVGNADLGATMTISNELIDMPVQKVFLQVADGVKSQTIDAEVNDLAVAIYFRTDDPAGMELRSRYVYLSDLGYSSIKGGDVIEIDWLEGNVADITGINIVSLGSLSVPVSGIYAANQASDGTVLQDYSVQSGASPKTTPERISFNGSVGLLNLTLETANDDSNSSSGTMAPIRMKVGYYDIYGVQRTDTFEDIRPYVTSGGNFAAGSVDTVRMLVPGMMELRWIELEPAGTGDTPATWRLKKLSAGVGIDGTQTVRNLDTRIVQGEPLHVSLADILMKGIVTVDGDDVSSAKTITSGENLSRLLNSGGGLVIGVNTYGSTEGFSAKIENYDPQTGATEKANLSETHGYTNDYLSQLISSAKSSASNGKSSGEKQAAQQVVNIASAMLNSYGSLTTDSASVVFRAPRNFSGRDLNYRITVYSNEMNDVLYTVDVKIYSEADVLSNAISLWRAEQSAAESQASAEEARRSEESSQPAQDTQTESETGTEEVNGGSNGE
ncbi:MAG: hypothetical protein K5772_08260 [Clostridia bacterium]|nr:hypothetical protein [Clostridia bacterium]